MDSTLQGVQLLTPAEAAGLRDAALRTIDQIREDYFPQIDPEDFLINFTNHESVVMKCAAYRWLTPSIGDLLLSRATHALKLDEVSYLHPIFYLRVSLPSEPQLSPAPLLESQPHFDRSYDLFADTFWLPLVDISDATGGLCFFQDDHILDAAFSSEWGRKNRYNYSEYVRNCAELDSILAPRIHKREHLPAGTAYHFDSNRLHAALPPKQDMRLSFDFRVVRASTLEDVPPSVATLVRDFNSNIDLSNTYGMLTLGDTVGAERQASVTCLDRQTVNRIRDLADIRDPGAKMEWRLEYRWACE